ncbi:MAG: Branched-chain amino acid aminotransferase [Myxococcaceae bacterium]|nr:Branched-chain amino acid aminotransferase [Myxococcaceae bacterium]
MSRSRPDDGPLGFGRYFTDHVAVATHDGDSWSALRIVPAGEPTADVVSGAVQYALSVFEGLKAYRAADGVVRTFRVDAHAKRFEASAGGLCLPPVNPSMFVDAVSSLTRVDADWCPTLERGALYIRPTIFASEPFLGVRPAATHTFVVVLSPVGAYFSGPERPLRLWAERERVRAAPGGVGWIKTGGNYAASLYASQQARARGFDQVLWLDALRHELLEEAGTMNVFVRIGERVYTPPVGQTVLAGVTRDSCLTLLRKWGVDVEERAVSLGELADAPAADLEIWGTGTAAGVSRIGEVAWNGGSVRANDATIATRLRDALTSIQSGTAPDEHGWLQPIEAPRT